MTRFFTYRSFGVIFTAIFVLGISLTLEFGFLRELIVNGSIPMHNRNTGDVSDTPAWALMLIFAGLNLFVVFGAYALLMFLFERVEVRLDSVGWRDVFGRLRFVAPLSEIVSCDANETQLSRGKQVSYRVTTGRSDFKFSQAIRDCDVLVSILRKAAAGSNQVSRAQAVSRLRVFDCRKGESLFWGTFLFFGCGAVLVAMFISDEFPWKGAAIIFPALLQSSFTFLGLYLLLLYANERITLDEHSIQWVDWLGRTRVTSSVSEISGYDISLASKGSIKTRSGVITVSRMMRNADQLAIKLKSLLGDAQQVMPPTARQEKSNSWRAAIIVGVICVQFVAVFIATTQFASRSDKQSWHSGMRPSGPNWVYNMQDAFAKAKSSHRLVLAYFYKANEPHLATYEVKIFPSKQFQATANEFVFAAIDMNEHPEVVQKYQVIRSPMFYFFTANEVKLSYLAGYTQSQPYECMELAKRIAKQVEGN